MYKVVVIEGKKIPFKADGRTARLYREYFKKDFLSEFFKMKNAKKDGNFDMAVFENLAWIMAKNANPKIQDIDKWLSQFNSPFSIIEAMDDILNVMDSSMISIVEPKKKKKKKKK